MVEHAQAIRWQKPRNCVSVFYHFCGVGAERFTSPVGGTVSIEVKNWLNMG